MTKKINRKDINGIQLFDGDIVAESSLGKVIWDGKGIIKSRPLGIVTVHPTMKAKVDFEPEETDRYNIIQIRTGEVELTDKANAWMNDGDGTCELHLSKYDGCFFNWDEIEKIGSVYDLDD